MTFVFRNNTIERFLRGDYQFSGYNDFSNIPDADAYLWWYQIPIKYNVEQLISEISLYADKLRFVANQIGHKSLEIFTLENIYIPQIQTGNNQLWDAIVHFNTIAYSLAATNKNITIIPFNDFTRKYAISDLVDWKYYYLYQIPLNPKLANDFHKWLERQRNSNALKRKKCLVVDLDNTLWFGILGEDGVDGISFDGDYPGKAFALWQEGLKQLKESGVILAICSKNNLSDVQELWEKRPQIILHTEDFAAMRINWQDKVSNIESIANELNIGLDSIVFIDDNPNEREFVRGALPMITVPEWTGQPYDLATLYNQLVEDYFQVYILTDEDKQKTQQYKQNALRQQMQIQYASLEDFVRSLQLQLVIQEMNEITLSRVAQMTQKTNQFNLTTKRYTETDILNLKREGAIIYTLSVADKFGDNGITGCVIVKADSGNWVIDTLLLSCRILGKGIEYVFVKKVLSLLKQKQVSQVKGDYYPTAKNTQVAQFYDKLGFVLSHEENGSKHYLATIDALNLDIEDYYTIKI